MYSKYYPTLARMRRKVAIYFKTVRHKADVWEHLYRNLV